MADLMTALRNADAAGDTEAAQRIAAMIKAQRQAQQPVADAQPTQSLQDLHKRALSGEQIPKEQFAAAAQGLTQEQQLEAYKKGRETSFDRAMGEVVGGAEGLASMATGAVATPIAGIAGGLEALNPFTEEGAGARRVQQIQEGLTYQPRTEQGQQALEPVKALGEKLEAGKEYLGEETLEATGSPLLASIAHTLPDATLSLFGLKTIGRPTPQQAAQTKALTQIKQPYSKAQTVANQKLSQMIIEGSDSADIAGVKLSANNLKSKITDGLPRIVNDKVAKAAMDQGLDATTTAMVKASNSVEKTKFNQMLNIAEKSLKHRKFGAKNSVGDVAGDSLLARINDVKRVNRRLNNNLESVVNKDLTGKRVNNAPAFQGFIDDLKKMDVGVSDNMRGLDFTGSSIEGGASGATTAQNIIRLTLSRLNNISGKENAVALHKLKRFIDKQVEFGKTSTGGKGAAEVPLKNLRRNINNILGENFPRYGDTNRKLSTSIEALKDTQKALGPSLDIMGETADKAIGTKLRSLTNNTQARSNLMNSMSKLEDAAISGGIKYKDRILDQVLFANDLEKLFKIQRETSLKGIMTDVAADAATGSNVQAALRAGKTIKDKIKGQSPDKAIKAIRELLKETSSSNKP